MTPTSPQLLCFLLAVCLLGLVSGARLPRKLQRRSQQSIDISGADVLRTYVCSPDADELDGTTDESDATSLHKRMNIPTNQVQTLQNELQTILLQLAALLGTDVNPAESACLSALGSPLLPSLALPSLPPLILPSLPPLILPTLPPLFPPAPGASHLAPVTSAPSRVSIAPPLPTLTSQAVETPPRLGPGTIDTSSPFHPFFPDPFRTLSATGLLNTSVSSPTGYLNGTQRGNASTTYLLGSAVATRTAASVSSGNSSRTSVVALSTTGPPLVIVPPFLPPVLTVPVIPLPSVSLSLNSPHASSVPTPSINLPPTTTATGIIVLPFLTASAATYGPSPSPGPGPSLPVPLPGGPSPKNPRNQIPMNNNPNPSLAKSISAAQSTYVFNPESSANVAVYYGQSPATSQITLAQQCGDPNVDMVILAFVTEKTASGSQYPGINFGAACGGQTPIMEEEAPGLLSCPDLANDIQICQNTYGKKVLLSIGGATGGVSFTSDNDAAQFGNTLWELFGPPGSSIDPDLRPFGNVSIDGFDVDNENDDPQYYSTLATTLRSLYTTTQTPFYLTSAPQCPYPDASNPLPLLLLCDFVFIQFYNNPPCEIGSPGFIPSIQTWSSVLSSSSAKLFIGAPSWSAAGASAYAKIQGIGEGGLAGFEGVAQEVGALGVGNLGGFMFWDGPEGEENLGVEGRNVFEMVKVGLGA